MHIMVNHHIQRDILNRLMHSDHMRFSDLKPDGMESNIFMYHMAQLKKLGYVDKGQNGYYLLYKGLQYVDGIRIDTLRPHPQPKIIAILALQNSSGSWLIAERKLQPYIAQRMFISGEQHFDETFQEQPLRELSEKHLPPITMTYRGLADIQIHTDEGVLTHVLAHLHHGIYDGPTPPDDARFQYVWHDFAADTTPVMPGTKELHEHLQSTQPFAVSITAKMDMPTPAV
jgi:hypothetical protein